MNQASSRYPIRDKRQRVRQLRAFCLTVQLGSIGRAAERLELTQPAVSLQLRRLENECAAVLLERSSTGVSPTPAGEHLYAFAEPLVRGVDDLFGDFRLTLDQFVNIPPPVRCAVSSAGAAFVLPRYLKRFRDRYPEYAVHLRTTSLHEGIQRLVDDEVDLAFGVKDPYPEDILVYHELLTYRLVLIAPPDHPLAGRASVFPEETSAYPSVVPPFSLYSREFGRATARRFGTDASATIEVGGWGVLKRYVESGFGIAIIPNLCISDTDRLSIIDLEADIPTLSYGVFAPRDRLLAPPAWRLLRLLIPDVPFADGYAPDLPSRL